MKKRLLLVVLVLTLLLVLPFTGHTTPFNSLIVFGDSLSDDGKVSRFTDGPIWVETLADSLGADLYDFAYGGATTGYDNPAIDSEFTGLQWQVETFLPGVAGIADEALFTVWAGANDFLQERQFDTAANNIGIALEKLYAGGARDILVGNLPDVGATPAFFFGPNAAIATEWTLGFNSYLEKVLRGFETSYADVNIYRLDAYGSFSAYIPGTPEWANLFWVDGFHPSSAGHQLIADVAYSEVAPVPEPATVILLGTGLIGLAGLGRKRYKK